MHDSLPDIRVDQKIELTTLAETDLEDLVMQINDPYIYENTLTVPHPYTPEHAQAYLAHLRDFETQEGIRKDWMIRYNGKVIGGIGVMYNYGTESTNSEIGYWLGKAYRGRGLMTQIINAFVNHLFSATPLQILEAQVFPGNKASSRVLEKCGFTCLPDARITLEKNGEPKEAMLFVRKKASHLSAEVIDLIRSG